MTSEQRLAEIAERLENDIHLQDRTYRGKLYTNTFLGIEAINVLYDILQGAFSRKHTELLGRKLARTFDLVERVHQQRRKHLLLLDDKDSIYQFTSPESRRRSEDDENETVLAFMHKLMNGELGTVDDDDDDDDDQGLYEARALEMTLETMGNISLSAVDQDNLIATTTGPSFVDLQEAATALENGVHVKTYRYRGETYPDTFVGSDAVDVLMACRLASSRHEAEEIGQALLEKYNLFRRCIHPAFNDNHNHNNNNNDDDNKFQDNHYFYKFTLPEERTNLQTQKQRLRQDTSSLMEIAKEFKNNVVVQDRTHRLKTYKNSFLGWDAVSFLVDAGYASSRIDAVDLGKRLQKKLNLFAEAGEGGDSYDFQDDYYFYQLQNEEEEEEQHQKKTTTINASTTSTSSSTGSTTMSMVHDSFAPSSTVIQEHFEWKQKVQYFEDKYDFSSYLKSTLSRPLRWASSFCHRDPRWRIRQYCQEIASVPYSPPPTPQKEKQQHHPPSKIFTVWRPTSNVAIQKMMLGHAVGKGLDMKGKSAKSGKLSGYVPFLQIGDNKHKSFIRTLPRTGSIRIFFPFVDGGIEQVRERVEVVKKDMLERVAEAQKLLLGSNNNDNNNNNNNNNHGNCKEAQETIQAWDMVNDATIVPLKGYAPLYWGLEVPVRLFWEAFIVRQDITRKPGSHYDTGRPSIPANQDLNLSALLAKPTDAAPKAVLWQNDAAGDPFHPQELLMAYEEHGRVCPVVSDFDAFLVGTQGLFFDEALPTDQVHLLKWTITQIGKILDSPPRPGSWTKRWLENLDRETKCDGFHAPPIPRFGFGDPKSYSMMAKAVERLAVDGSVRHGAECFNYKVPQELDEEFLVISDDGLGRTGTGVPWKKMNERELQEFLVQKIEDGFTFPLNPKWILCDPGWKILYDRLLSSNEPEVQISMRTWYPPESGIREQIQAISSRHPGAFEGGPLRSQEEVQKKFAPILRKEGNVHCKAFTSFIRRGIKGEKVVTNINGLVETENTVRDDTSWVVCGRAAGEHYILSNEEFHASYDEVSAKAIRPDTKSNTTPANRRLLQQGYKEYKSKRKVLAHKVDESDMVWFCYGNRPKSNKDGRAAAFFVAPWREYTRVEKGDVLVMQYAKGNDEIYRIERFVFRDSYEPEQQDLRILLTKPSKRYFSGLMDGADLVEEESTTRSAGLDGRPLRSQKEVQERFIPLLKEEGAAKVYRKAQTSYIRRAVKGEKIFTTIDGILETEYVVQNSTSWVVCGKAAGEYYVQSDEDFQSSYVRSSARPISETGENLTLATRRLHEDGFLEYDSKRQVRAHRVDKDDMNWFHFGNPSVGDDKAAYFMAPWREFMRVEEGDMLVARYPGGDDEVYRVESLVFEESYKPLT